MQSMCMGLIFLYVGLFLFLGNNQSLEEKVAIYRKLVGQVLKLYKRQYN